MESNIEFDKQNETASLQKLPNATTVLILGIVSFLLWCCCCITFPIHIGIITAVIGIVLANKSEKIYKADPSNYSNYNHLTIGRILCIVSLVIMLLHTIYTIIVLVIYGGAGMMEMMMFDNYYDDYYYDDFYY
ncbi:MAG: hypothetical protein CL823_05585 [Crocinitomicaceae bacterium]|nr:hypothetical protein [Crocinitomicaceae bacterium]